MNSVVCSNAEDFKICDGYGATAAQIAAVRMEYTLRMLSCSQILHFSPLARPRTAWPWHPQSHGTFRYHVIRFHIFRQSVDNLGMDPTIAICYYGAFVFLLGLCIGSFLNVVIWRLPNGGREVSYAGKTAKLSLSWPPSHCPMCDAPVRWYQNIPVLSWIFLRGRCANCKVSIPIRYPLVELATGGIFLAFYLAYFKGDWQPGFGDLQTSWPVLALHLFMIAALLAASAIDADWFIIPLEIPWLIAGVALLSGPFFNKPFVSPIDYGGDERMEILAHAVISATIGLMVANLLLWFKVIRPSFPMPESTESQATDVVHSEAISPLPSVKNNAPWLLAATVLVVLAVLAWIVTPAHTAALVSVVVALLIFLLGILPRDESTVDVTQDVEDEINMPGARKNILREIFFLLIPLAGACMAAVLPFHLPVEPHLQRLLGIVLGILAGGGIVWVVRIGGTLLFGREAMGSGDVHLMAGVGAILGWKLVIMAFFIAPFLGLFWALLRLIMRKSNVLPYGPWLSLASILSLLIANPIANWYFEQFLRGDQ